jgi:hypothetical protein
VSTAHSARTERRIPALPRAVGELQSAVARLPMSLMDLGRRLVGEVAVALLLTRRDAHRKVKLLPNLRQSGNFGFPSIRKFRILRLEDKDWTKVGRSLDANIAGSLNLKLRCCGCNQAVFVSVATDSYTDFTYHSCGACNTADLNAHRRRTRIPEAAKKPRVR